MTGIQFKLLFLCFLVLVAGSAVADEKQTAQIEVGWIGPLTGTAAVLGVDALAAVKMAFDDANQRNAGTGPNFAVVSEDDRYETAKTIAAYQHLVNVRGIKVLLIYTYSGLLALAERAEKDGVLLIDPLDCDRDIAALPSNTVCVAKQTEDMSKTIAVHALEQRTLPAAIIYFENDAFPLKAALATRDLLVKSGSEPAVFEGYGSSTTDFRPLFLKIKQKSVGSIFFFGYEEVGVGIKQMRELGINTQVYALSTVLSAANVEVAGDSLNNTKVPDFRAERDEAYDNFIAKFRKRTGAVPALDLSTVPSFDVANLLVQALSESRGKLSPSDVQIKAKDFFYNVKNYDGVSGKFSMQPDGSITSLPIAIKQVKNGKAEVIE